MFRRLLAPLLRVSGLEPLYYLRRSSLLAQDGWFRSYREGAAVDRDGKPIPWYSYPAIEFLTPRVRPDLTVFEYGAGNSTIWWAARAASVFSVEHDEAWIARVASRVPENVTLRHVPLDPPGEYARSLLRVGRKFDVVVIDGRERVECARTACEGLTDRGIIVFDNSDRPDYAEGYAALAAQGFRRIDFIGMVPVSVLRNGTTVFYRPGNWLDI